LLHWWHRVRRVRAKMVNTRNTKRKSSPAKASDDDARNASAKRIHRDDSDDEALGSDHQHNVLVPPRENDFNEKTWWMVDLDPVEETSLQGASVLVKRCMRTYNWDEAKARKVLAAYRQFIILKKKYQDWNAEILSPCYLVDQMWHCHILDVVNYCHDMMLLCGHVVGHNPDGALDSAAKQKRDDTTRKLLQQHFGSYDEEIWNYSPDSASENVKSIANQSEGTAVQEEKSANSVMITIHIEFFNDEEVSIMVKRRDIKVKRTDRMEHVFNELASRSGLPASNLRFKLIDGENIHSDSTPESLGLNDNDRIHCFFTPPHITPPPPHDTNDTITIRLKDQMGEEVMFRVRKTTRMMKVFNAYAGRKGMYVEDFPFMIDGEEINPFSSPADLDCKENDIPANHRLVSRRCENRVTTFSSVSN
jgi:hypothetical protein